MKKLLLVLMGSLSTTLIALPVGNPADASLLTNGLFAPEFPVSFRFGFYGDYVYDKKMKFHFPTSSVDTVQKFVVNTNAAYLALNGWDRVDIFATLGESRLFLETNAIHFTGGDGIIRIHFKNEFSWSVGARVTLWECGGTFIGVEGQFFQYDPHLSHIIVDELFILYDDSPLLRLREWQIGLGISHRFSFLCPYVAVKYSRARFNVLENPSAMGMMNDPIFTSQRHWGFAVGTTVIACQKISVTAEARFANERALHVNAQIRF